MNLALLSVFGGGVLSFLSPCTLPLVPGYLAYISGLSAVEVESGKRSGTVFGASLLFVLGFSLIFVASGATASYIGATLQPYHGVLGRAAGAFTIAMGLVLLGLVRFPWLYQERRFHLGRDFGVWSSLPLGMAFGFGWTPCIGPILAPILAYAASQASVQHGALLLFVYALGLGLPFLVVALFAGRAFQSLGWIRRYSAGLNAAGGAVLIAMGIFLVMGRWTELLAPAMRWYAQFNLPT
ncbi:MAG: cytochrome c biogenesis CcdA family protein [Chloroflexota bacterium]